MENLAHRKQVSINDIVPAFSFQSSSTLLSYLIDGYDVPSRCTTIDSSRCRNNEPHLTIDLNRNVFIQGVIIQQLDTCKSDKFSTIKISEDFHSMDLVSHLSQDDYYSRLQLDRIDVHITRDIQIDLAQYQNTRCAFLTRNTYAIRSSRIHLQCQTPIFGRFIHIQLFGIRTAINRTDQRLTLPFKAHFCEIYAYNWSIGSFSSPVTRLLPSRRFICFDIELIFPSSYSLLFFASTLERWIVI